MQVVIHIIFTIITNEVSIFILYTKVENVEFSPRLCLSFRCLIIFYKEQHSTIISQFR